MPLVADALGAFAIDPEYAVAMAHSAATIARKRLTWECRIELRAASAEAVEQCRTAETFVCESTSPCGTGAGCRFARAEYADLDLPDAPGRLRRPQPRDGHGTFDLEAAIHLLRDRRQADRPSAK